ncbi:RDD family protein [Blastopirellula marina]|uniref:RDD domain-containing protein n=1 Tax=Blastopirellula marina DSM 3645 TaxID=314230 RepID=A3ZQ22_9BACT|nr:RDD family protein [Blastopirellula marina]EAQ81295.1 hypothetical protein DSM3645_22926 [Blastopirellula marina DSM 3645]
MNEPEPQNPFASPATDSRNEDPLAAQLSDLPTRQIRLSAAIIDFMIVDLPAMFVGGFLLPTVEAAFLPFDETGNVIETWYSDWLFVGTAIFTTLFFYLLVEGYLVATRSQTVGKAAMGIKIIRRNGQPAGFMRLVFVRYFPWLCFYYAQIFSLQIPMFGLWFFVRLSFSSILLDPAFLLTKEKRCLHDYFAGTIVVKA